MPKEVSAFPFDAKHNRATQALQSLGAGSQVESQGNLAQERKASSFESPLEWLKRVISMTVLPRGDRRAV